MDFWGRCKVFVRIPQGGVVTLSSRPLAPKGANAARPSMANTTTITGNLTREPENRYTREGEATTQLGVAVNRRWQDRTTQEWQESTSFFDVICWRDLAENVALSLAKGMRVVVTGRLEQRTWETEEGEHRSKVEITADEVGPSLRFATADVHRVDRRADVRDEMPVEGHECRPGSSRRPAGPDWASGSRLSSSRRWRSRCLWRLPPPRRRCSAAWP